jgi:PTS system nitrogen regulatory IIA component
MVADTGRLWKPDELAGAVRNREELHPTALENGVALLHPRRSQASFYGESFVALAITPSGLPCGGPRGSVTDIFFLIASSDDAFHLRLLARLSRIVNQPDVLNELRNAKDSSEACQILYTADDELN